MVAMTVSPPPNANPSYLDNLLRSAGILLRALFNGEQVGPTVSNLNVTGSATLNYDATTGRHNLNILSGFIGVGISNSVYCSDGTVNGWNDNPTLNGLSMAGGLVLYNNQFIKCENPSRMLDSRYMLGLDADNGMWVAGMLFPNPPILAQAGQYLGVAGDYTLEFIPISIVDDQVADDANINPNKLTFGAPGIYTFLTSDGSVNDWRSADNLGLLTNSDRIVLIKTGQDSGYGAVFDATKRGTLQVAQLQAGTAYVTLAEVSYANMGSTNTNVTYQVAHVELTICGNDGIDPSPGTQWFRRTFAGIIRRNRTGSDAWEIAISLQHLSGLDVNAPQGTVIANLSLSGSHNGDIAIGVSSTLSASIYEDWVYELRVYGGGRYVPA